MRRSRAWIVVAASLAVIFVGCNGLARMTYYCSECATDCCDLQVCLPKNRKLFTLYSLETPTPFAAIRRSVEPGPCPHRWVYARGQGGWFIDGKGLEARRTLLQAMEKQGVVTAASRVDAAGALELIRWVLRTDIPEDVAMSQCVGPDQRAVDFDSPQAFRAWFDDLRRKVSRS
ncbi:MAG TPA: hypothetical protein VJU16_03955 [Planctomycetota bacterium]|nr:hypothetical protein [Planctomycetota bacterium]